jgi:hypothetical protein
MRLWAGIRGEPVAERGRARKKQGSHFGFMAGLAGLSGLAKDTDHKSEKNYPDMSNKSTHPQNVSKNPNIFDTFSWL